MSEPFIAEIKIFAGNFAPRNFAFCDGQLLPIAQNQALYALVGNTYGGDGRTTLALPDLRGRVPMHAGSGAGLTERVLGERVGVNSVTITEAEMPAHDHPFAVAQGSADSGTPTSGNTLAAADTRAYRDSGNLGPMAPTAGAGQAHDNRQPFLALNFIIALVGLFPSRP